MLNAKAINPAGGSDDRDLHRGFTLVELMIVVAIVAILAGVAIVAYTRHVKSGRLVGVRQFVAHIQARQAAYFQQHGWYCNASPTAFYPALGTAGREPAAKTWNPSAAGWKDLGARPEANHSYVAVQVRASDESASPAHPLAGDAARMGIPAQPTASSDAGPALPHPWYYVVGHVDLNGDATYASGGCSGDVINNSCTVLWTSSARSEIVVRNEGD